MANARGDEKSSVDGLEIISIGKMYSGPWDKKYWSSSRGKDRYPYPIGYNAVRTHNGVTYKMEILEGLKGPLFTISSTDGKSCSGQTPDIAWECFQKKGSSQIKLWHGKRFSCKIDGVEFFGFRNAFVQRLLRELVANVTGTVEQGFPPSGVCNGATETRNQLQSAESTTCTDLLPHLEKPRVTGKRSRKNKFINFKSVKVDVVQNLCPQARNHNYDAAKSIESSATLCASDENYASCGSPHAPVDLEDVLFKESRQTLSERDSKLDFPDISCSHKVNDLLLQDPTRLSHSGSFEAVEEDGSFPKDKEFETQHLSNNIDAEILISDTLQNVNNANAFAPDSFDLPPDESFDSGTKIPSEADNVKDKTVATDFVISEVLVTESRPEDAAGSSIPNCSQQSETDLFGQEIAKSMMTLLLPRAVPLLKTFSRRKKKNVKSSEDFQSDEGNKNNGVCQSVASTVTERTEKLPLENQGNMHPPNSHSVVPNFSHIYSVVPDSFDNDEPGRYLSNPLAQYSGDAEVDPAHLSGEPGMAEPSRLVVSVNTEAGCPVCHAGPIDCRTGLCSGRQIALNQGAGEGDSSKCIPHLGCRCSPREDNCLKSSEISLCGNIHSRLEDFENLPDGTGDITTSANLVETKKPLCVPPQESNLDTMGSELPASNNPVVATGSSMMCTSLLEGELHGDSKDTCGSKIDAHLHSLASSKFSEVSSFCQIPSRGCLPSNVTQEAPRDRDLAVDDSGSYLHDNRVGNMTENIEVKECSYSKAQMFLEHNKLLAKYVHPGPISMVLLRIRENEMYICAVCGIFGQEEKMLFLYKALMEGENMGCPSFIGHVSLVLPSFRDAFGRDVSLEKSALQFTPDAKSLVLLNCIRTPCCREGDIHCPCGSCKANSCEKNAVKIVGVEDGFISVVTKLKTSKSVCSILVCEPSFLIAAEESGKLYLWLMNSSWSAKTEECYLPTSECVPPCSMELKKIPKSTALVLGHNGLGEFCLWDISKRSLVSTFSAPGTSFYQFIPVSCFSWQQKGIFSVDTDVEEYINEIVKSTGTNHGAFPTDVEDVAIWLLTLSGPDPQCGHTSSQLHTDTIRCWKLGLLTKNMMIMGSAMDPRAVVVGASAAYGIIGRHDGLVYMWELSTGVNLGSFHHFKGERPSCIATEDSESGAFAIASDGGQLRIYLQS